MPIEPLRNLPAMSGKSTSGSSPLSGSSIMHFGRKAVQDSRVSMGQVMGERDQATTSINRAGGIRQGAVTSIFNVGKDANSTTTSIARPKTLKHSQGADEFYDQDADENRYSYIRRLIRQRKASEVDTKDVPTQTSSGALKVKTGGGFKTKILKKQLFRMIKASPATYKSMGEKERKYVLDMVSKRAKAVKSGAGFGNVTRRSMKNQIEKDRQGGSLSSTNAKLMKKLVDDLPH